MAYAYASKPNLCKPPRADLRLSPHRTRSVLHIDTLNFNDTVAASTQNPVFRKEPTVEAKKLETP